MYKLKYCGDGISTVFYKSRKPLTIKEIIELCFKFITKVYLKFEDDDAATFQPQKISIGDLWESPESISVSSYDDEITSQTTLYIHWIAGTEFPNSVESPNYDCIARFEYIPPFISKEQEGWCDEPC